MGRTFVRRVPASELGVPRKVIVYARDEARQHEMRLSLSHTVYVNRTVWRL